MKSGLHKVAHGQVYITSRTKRTGQALERGAGIFETERLRCDTRKM